MKIFGDYHMHTPLCGHAVGLPSQYAERAIKVGFKEIGFSDHAPLVSHLDPAITMNRQQLPLYHAMIEDVKRRFAKKLTVKIGIEADFLPGFENATKAILASYPYDFVLGSVHFMGRWGFDDPAERNRWSHQDVNQVYRDYYELLRQSAKSRLFDVIAHCDLVKKFGNRPTADMTEEIRKTARIFKETGLTIEINTSGLRKPVKEIYPALSNLKIYCAAKVPLTFGSDAHNPNDVGRDFDKGIALAKKAGYREYVIFKQRKIWRTIKFAD